MRRTAEGGMQPVVAKPSKDSERESDSEDEKAKEDAYNRE